MDDDDDDGVDLIVGILLFLVMLMPTRFDDVT